MACRILEDYGKITPKGRDATKAKGFWPILQDLESQLITLKIVQTEATSSTLEAGMRSLRNFLVKKLKKSLGFPTRSTLPFSNCLGDTATPAEKLEAMKTEIKLIKSYMSSHAKLYSAENDHTDILNIYWHSKTEVSMTEKIASCLEHFKNEISKLEQ